MAVVDVERLFKQFTVHEIKDIEKKVKSDIERKKEDLRQMVGRRYRDIIEAADSIKEMKNSSEEILNCVRHVQKSLTRLETLQIQLASVQQKAKFRAGLSVDFAFSHENLCKFFGDLSELIWESLDDNKSLDAAYFFVLANHVYRSIKIDNAHRNDEEFVESSWSTIQNTRSKILQCCFEIFGDMDAEDAKIVDALCAIILVDNLKVDETFKRFLDVRKNVLSSFFENTDSAGREQICAALNLIQNTISSSFVIFMGVNVDECPLDERLKVLRNGVFQSSVLSNYLKFQCRSFVVSMPQDLKNFRCDVESSPISVDKYKLATTDWLESCLTFCREKIDCVLNYFETVDSLIVLKSSAVEVLSKHVNDPNWINACTKLLGSEFSIWNSLVSSPLQTRMNFLMQNNLSESFSSLYGDITKLTDEKMNEIFFSKFLWTHLPTDNPIFADNAQKPNSANCSLVLKANGLSMNLFEPCFSMDTKIRNLKETVEKFLDFNDYLEKRRFFELRADVVWQAFADYSTKYLNDLLAKFESIRTKGVDDESTQTLRKTVAIRNILYAKICRCLAELCPNLKSIVQWQDESTFADKTRRSQIPDAWMDVRTNLTNCSIKLFSVWSGFAVSYAATCFDLSTNSGFDDKFWLANVQEWEAIEIEEEAEDGRKVKSKVFVPSVCSKFVHEFFYGVCQSLCSIGAHIFPRECLSSMNLNCFTKLVEFYEKILAETTKIDDERRLRQKQAVQLLFDLKFVSAFLNWKQPASTQQISSNDLEKRLTALCGRLESFVDPFDLDVFTPYLKRNVVKQMHKCQASYGVLLTADTIFAHYRKSSAAKNILTTSTEQSQVLILSDASTGRFHLLPVQHDAPKVSSFDSSKSNVKSTSNLSAGAKHALPHGVDTLHPSASFTASLYDKLSSSWFGM